MPKIITFPFTFTHKPDTDLTALLGGKGANLHRMIELGLPVPEGFTIPTEQCLSHAGKKTPSAALASNLRSRIEEMEADTGRTFGGKHPLLVSVRSGAPISMPGMMETILNLGMNATTVKALAHDTNDEQFAHESWLRFLKMFGVIVCGREARWYDERIAAAKRFAASDRLDVATMQTLIKNFRKEGPEVPDDPYEQLDAAVMAVFQSWESDKAKKYREIEGIPDDLGTAVNVQRMVFGNMNDDSGTGVAFTRDPNTGENVRFGDFLVNAQGEDVVDGSHVTMPLAEMADYFPEQAELLEEIMVTLEDHYRDMCDIEFTIENGDLYMLQTRVGKRNPNAAIRIAFEMFDAGIINRETAVSRVQEAAAKAAPASQVDKSFDGMLAVTGLGATSGIATGKVVLTSDDAVNEAEKGNDVILVRMETSPEDVAGIAAAKGILTATGGLVSHAAVVARGWSKPCVVGASSITSINPAAGKVKFGDIKVKYGDIIQINGETGDVFVANK